MYIHFEFLEINMAAKTQNTVFGLCYGYQRLLYHRKRQKLVDAIFVSISNPFPLLFPYELRIYVNRIAVFVLLMRILLKKYVDYIII